MCMLNVLCSLMSIPRQTADAFLTELQKEAFANAHELLGEVPAAAQRLWTSALKMMSVPACVCMSACVCMHCTNADKHMCFNTFDPHMALSKASSCQQACMLTLLMDTLRVWGTVLLAIVSCLAGRHTRFLVAFVLYSVLTAT